MAVLLFKLNHVPDDEAAEVRRLVEEHRFHTYETHRGFWGLGVAAIWLVDKEQLSEARAVIDAYQAERSARQRQDYAEQKARGEAPTIRHKLTDNPVRFVATLAGIILVLGVSTVPLWWLMSQ